MSKNQNIIKNYDKLVDGKRQGMIAMYLVVTLSFLVVLFAFVFSYNLQSKAIDTVKVMDASGKIIKTETKRQEEVFVAALQAHLSATVEFANSFDRSTLGENKAKTRFLMDNTSADRIFNAYNTRGAYNDALENGTIYKTKFLKMTHFEGKSEPFLIAIEAETTISQGDKKKIQIIKGEGKIAYRTASYPTNPQGLWLFDYVQSYSEKQVKEDD